MQVSPSFVRFEGIKFSVVFIFVCIPFLFIIPVITAFLLIIRPVVWLMYKIFRSDLDGFVNGMNTIFTLGKSANFPLNTIGIAVVNGEVTARGFQQNFQERVLSLKKPNGELLYEGLMTYWIKFLGYPFWKKDEYFDLKNHVREFDYTEPALPSEPSESDLYIVVGKLIQAPWKKHRSPWEILFIKNYKGESKTVQLLRFDHVLADGLSIYEMYKVITQSEWRIPHFKLSERSLTSLERLGLVFKMPYDVITNSLKILGLSSLPFQAENTNIETIFSVSPEISVDVIKSIKNHFKVNYAAVIYSATAGAIARALESAGKNVPKYYATTIVVPKSKHPGGLCIHAELLVAKLPLGAKSPEKRLIKIQKCLTGLSNCTAGKVYNRLAKALTVFPSSLLTSATVVGDRMIRLLNVAHSIVPVTTSPDYYEGMEISELTIAISIVINVGMMISMGGVNNKQRVSFCVNKNMFKSEDIARSMGTFFAEEIQALVNATT